MDLEIVSVAAPKLCYDPECLKVTYICIRCRNITCKHYCSSRDTKGNAICGKYILEERVNR